MQSRVGILLILFVLISLCHICCDPFQPAVQPFQPDVPQGGRAVSIAVRPDNNQIIFVASETGGLFFTKDGGVKWTHANGLPNYHITDIAISDVLPTTMIATADVDFKAANNGVIWRSTDGGITWYQPAGSIPSAGSRCGTRVSAYSVAVEPGSNNVFAGTDCGLAISRDLGANWVHVVLDSTVPVNSEKTQNRVWSVLAQSGGKLNLSAADGLWYSTDDGANWNKSVSPPFAADWTYHALAASPYDSNHLFLVVGEEPWEQRQMFWSNDGGAHWTLLQAPSDQGWKRPSFVRTAKTGPAGSNQFLLYFGSGVRIWRQAFIENTSGPVGSGTWEEVHVDHHDPADIAFDSSGTSALLLATDGGVHKTRDNGATWSLTGGGSGGFDALQITEITGQSVFGKSPHQDLYYGTQDNGIVASNDGGMTWPNNMGGEGFYLRTLATTSDDSTSKVTGVRCGDCMNFLADAQLLHWGPWPDATGGPQSPRTDPGTPFLLLQPGHYIENTYPDSTRIPTFNHFMLTRDTGSTWSFAYSVPQELRGAPVIVGPDPLSPVIYQAVRRPGSTSDGNELVGLIKVTNIYGLGAIMSDADGAGFGSLGVFPTMFAWYWVFAADPSHPERLMMADIDTNQMKRSLDGGQTWSVDQALTDLVTSNGAFDFREAAEPLVHSIAFDPYDSCDIVVGTAQNGVIRSTDGGHSWTKISGSEQVTNLSSFYFPPKGPILVSTYGRGLWQLAVRRRIMSCDFKFPPSPQEGPTIVDPSTGAHVQFKDFGNPEICPGCQYVVVLNGAVTNVKLKGLEVAQVVTSGGSVYQLLENKKEVPLQISNAYSKTLGGFSDNGVFQSLMKEQTPIRGLVVQGNLLKGIIVSQAQLRFRATRIPYIHVLSRDMRGGIPRMVTVEKVVVEGEGWAPSRHTENLVRIRLADEIVADRIRVDKSGNFTVQIEVKRPPGVYEITVEQKEKKRTSLERSRVTVVPPDRTRL